MAIPVPSVEAYLPATLDSVRTLQISEDDAVYLLFSLPSSPEAWLLDDALAEWASQATASGFLSNTYTFERDSAGVITLSSSGTFYVRLEDSLAPFLGFSSSQLSGASSYQPDVQGAGWLNVAVDYDAPKPVETIKLQKFRFGFPSVLGFSAGSMTTLKLYLSAEEYDAVKTGPLFTCLVRVYPLGFTSGAYSPTNERGYLDVYLHKIVRTEPLGPEEDFYEVTVEGVLSE